jgi:hypothetical protein
MLALISFKTITLNSLSPDLGAGFKKDDSKKISWPFPLLYYFYIQLLILITYIVTYVRFPPLIYPSMQQFKLQCMMYQ